jgi:hypothetical protein
VADLAAPWGGYISAGSGETGVCFGFRWNAAQNGSTVSGQSAIKALGRGESFDDPTLGTMTATPSGGEFAVNVEFARIYPGDITCSMRGGGTVKAGQSAMSGIVTLEWTPGCQGNLFAVRGAANPLRGTMNVSKGADARTCP